MVSTSKYALDEHLKKVKSFLLLENLKTRKFFHVKELDQILTHFTFSSKILTYESLMKLVFEIFQRVKNLVQKFLR